MIMECDCVNSYQDSKYGKNRRVFNESGNKPQAKCTSCLKIKSITLTKELNKIQKSTKKSN